MEDLKPKYLEACKYLLDTSRITQELYNNYKDKIDNNPVEKLGQFIKKFNELTQENPSFDSLISNNEIPETNYEVSDDYSDQSLLDIDSKYGNLSTKYLKDMLNQRDINKTIKNKIESGEFTSEEGLDILNRYKELITKGIEFLDNLEGLPESKQNNHLKEGYRLEFMKLITKFIKNNNLESNLDNYFKENSEDSQENRLIKRCIELGLDTDQTEEMINAVNSGIEDKEFFKLLANPKNSEGVMHVAYRNFKAGRGELIKHLLTDNIIRDKPFTENEFISKIKETLKNPEEIKKSVNSIETYTNPKFVNDEELENLDLRNKLEYLKNMADVEYTKTSKPASSVLGKSEEYLYPKGVTTIDDKFNPKTKMINPITGKEVRTSKDLLKQDENTLNSQEEN